MKFQSILETLLKRQDLTTSQSISSMHLLLNGELTSAQISAFLVALSAKGVCEDEFVGFITTIRKFMTKVQSSGVVLDTCGTGGDQMETFNISTAVALVCAGAGIAVAKHGNRAATSSCGSADVLEEIGVKIMLSPSQAEKVLKSTGIVFLFAPLFHPAFRYVVPVRKELGIKTVFNYLGPFVNPAGVKRQVIGIGNLKYAKILSRVAAQLGYNHLVIVCGEDGMDEVSICGKTHVFEIEKKILKQYTLAPKDIGIKQSSLTKIKGGDSKENAQILMSLLKGEKSAYRDAVLLNASLAIKVSGKAKNLKEGLRLAVKSIDQGSALFSLQSLIKNSHTV